MKIVARVGAIVSFTSFFVPGVWVFNQAKANDGLAFILGCCLVGIAVFAGTMLWLVGERGGAKG